MSAKTTEGSKKPASPRGRKPKKNQTQSETPAVEIASSRESVPDVGVKPTLVKPESSASAAPPKRGRGRPRKTVVETQPASVAADNAEDQNVDAEVAPKAKSARKAPSQKKAAPNSETVADASSKSAKKPSRSRKKAADPALPLLDEPHAADETLVAAPPAQPETVETVVPEEKKESPARGRGRPRKKAAPAVRDEAISSKPEETAEIVAKSEEKETSSIASKAEEEELPRFADLHLSEPIMRAIEAMGYERPTPIQAKAIPSVLQGRDVLGVAQTGTGKTASFTLPMLEILSGSRARARMPRSLILEPTRELALQVAENFKLYGQHLRLTHALLIGGESMSDQRAALNQGVDVLIATPGRLLDLFDRGGLLLTQTRILVIDEADRMLDMGFIPDIERIVSLLPAQRQTLFFSATMAPEIRRLADAFLHNPEEITVSRASSVATTIAEALLVVNEHDKRRVLRKLLRRENVQNAIVFCNRKRDVDTLYKSLDKHHFAVGHLHGDLPQSLRFSTLERFKNGELKILVCSDVAARGIDISGLSHVFNFDLPFNAEDYVHRIGRTGRAGNEGHAFSLATPYQRPLAEAIEALTHKTIAQPQIEGIETLPWADPEESANHQNQSRHRRKNKNGRRDERQAPASTEHRPEHQQAPRENTQRPPERTRSVAPTTPFDRETPATGFGHDTPAFMLLPRRNRNRGENDERQGPIQHRGAD
nr:DEAD/DEAH box helicase [Kozakia baliensis]